MTSQTVEALIAGGKCSAAPPLGPALGPLGVNIGQVVTEINKKTSAFNGMQVPVKVTVDTDTKNFEIEIGTPPAASLILKEAGIEKGSGNPLADKVADVRIEQIIKVAKMKETSLSGKTLKEMVKEIVGTCNSMGILVGGKPAKEAIQDINEGKYDKEIKEEKTELSVEELKALEEEKKKLAEEMEKRRAEYERLGREILSKFSGKEKGIIKSKMVEAGIPAQIIKELMPAEEAAAGEGEKKEGAAEAPKPEEKK